MKTVNKSICVLLALIIALVQFPISTLAKNENVPSFEAEQTNVTSEDGLWTYDIALDKYDEPRVWITDYNNNAEAELVIPSTIDGMRVQSVDIDYLSNTRNCTKLVFEENIERIAGRSFHSLNNVSIELPSSLLMIDNDAFFGSKITSINLPDGLVAIGETAFQRCTFSDNTDIVIPESVRYLGLEAFDNTNITSVKIGSKTDFSSSYFSQTVGVYYKGNVYTGNTEYPYSPFTNCSKLTKLEIDENNPYFKTVDGTVYSSDDRELVFINSYPADYVIPYYVEYVCKDVFKNKTFDSMLISSDIKNFTGIEFSGTSIGKLSFADDCTYDTIPPGYFQNCKIDEVTIPKSIKTIVWDAFRNCGIKVLNFEEDSQLTEIDMSAFQNNDFKTLDLTNCKYLTEIQEYTFRFNSSLESVDMTGVPLEVIPQMAFEGCSKLKDFKLSQYTKTIGYCSFMDDTALENIDLSNIAKCNSNSFEDCPNINISDYLLSSGTTEDGFEYNEFANHISLTGYTCEDTTLVIPDTINGKPVTDISWDGSKIMKNKWIKRLELPSKLEYISSKAFDYKYVSEVNAFPDTLRFIGVSAFNNATLTSVELNDGIEVVLGAFGSCPIENFVIPDSVVVFGNTNCSSAHNVTFGKQFKNIQTILDYMNRDNREVNITISPENPYYCFENGVLYNRDKTEIYMFYPCYNIDEISPDYVIPDTVKIIDENAFKDCTMLKIASIPSGVEYIGKYAFWGCTAFGDLIIPASVKYIGTDAFMESSLTSVHFADGFKTQTLDNTFAHCQELQSVTYGDVDIKILKGTYIGSGIKNIDIPESVEVLRSTYFFTDLSNITELKLPKGLKVLRGAFDGSHISITEITIPSGVETIGAYTFENCKLLKTVDLANVKFLERGAFAGCESLESIDLTGVTYFAESHWSGTFYNCPNLKKITFNRTDRDYDIEESSSQGNDSVETVVVGNGIHSVKRKAFADCKNLKTAVISDSVESISDDAFKNCNKLTIVCTEDSNAAKYAQHNGIKYKTFKIHPLPDQMYTGKAIKPSLLVTVGDNALVQGKDYTATYSDNIEIGTARAIAAGLGDYSIYAATVKFNIIAHKHQYTAKTVKPTYEKAGYTLYTCACGSSYKSDKKPKLTVPKTAISKLTAKKKALNVKWKAVKGVTGYQVQYSTKKSFKNKKTITVNGAKSVSKTVKKLSGKRKYFVRVRAYKTYGGKNYYSEWSKPKSVTTKK